MFHALVEILIKRPRITLSVYLFLLVLTSFIAADLALDPSFSALISDDGEFNENERKLEAAFGQNNGLVVLFQRDDQSIISERPEDLRETTLGRDAEVMRSLLEESQYVTSVGPLVFSDDGRYARIGVGLFEPNRPGGLVDVQRELQSYVDESPVPPGVEVSITGLPRVLDRVSTLLITDNLRTVLITLALVFLVLVFFFRSARLALVGIASPAVSVVVLTACMVVLDIQVTLVLAAVGVIVLGLGADYSIHFMTAYVRHLQERHGPEQSILEAFDELDIALFGAFITTLAGFAALILGSSPASQSQGIVLSLAITIIFLTTVLLLPVLLVLFVREARASAGGAPAFVERFYDRLARLQARHPWRVILGVLGITVVMLFGAAQVGFSTSNSNWIPDDDPISEQFRELTFVFGNTDQLTIIVESTRGDLRNVQTSEDAQRLVARLEALPSIDSVQSPFADLPADPARVHEELSGPRASSFNKDFTLTTIVLSSSGFQINDAGESTILGQVRQTLDREPLYDAKVSLYGDVVRFDELGTSLQADTARTSLIGLGLVFLVASLLYFSLVVGVVALIPIILAVIWAVGLMGYFGVPFNSLSTGIVSLVLGIGVDFSIHLVNGVRYGMRRVGELEKAIRHALHTTGGAIFLSSVTTFFGFIALTFAQLLGTRRLGFSLAFSILSVFVVTILFVPAVLSARRSLLQERT